MNRDERIALIQMALGKASVAFMEQSGDVVMPTEHLIEVAEDIHAIWEMECADLTASLRQAEESSAAWRRMAEDAAAALATLTASLRQAEAENSELRADLVWALKSVWDDDGKAIAYFTGTRKTVRIAYGSESEQLSIVRTARAAEEKNG